MTTTTQNHRLNKDEILRTVNTILLTVIVIMIGTVTVWMRNMEVDRRDDLKHLNEKIDDIIVGVLTNTHALQTHESAADVWVENTNNRIKSLEQGTSVATSDRITKTEALAAVDNLRKYTEKYFERKQR